MAVKVRKYNNECLTEMAFVLFYLPITNQGHNFIARDRCQTHEITNQIKCPSFKGTPGHGLVRPSSPCLQYKEEQY